MTPFPMKNKNLIHLLEWNPFQIDELPHVIVLHPTWARKTRVKHQLHDYDEHQNKLMKFNITQIHHSLITMTLLLWIILLEHKKLRKKHLKNIIEHDQTVMKMKKIQTVLLKILFLRQEGETVFIHVRISPKNGLLSIWNVMGRHINRLCNTGRGKRASNKPKDVLFMVLAVLKHGEQWNWLGKMFKMSGTSFQRLILSFVHATALKFEEQFVENWSDDLSMIRMVKRNEFFPFSVRDA